MKLQVRWIAVLLILALQPRYGICLSSKKGLDQYVRASWGVEQGLPQSSVYAVAQTADGYVWAATEEGFVRFDGLRFVTFDKAAKEAITNNFVRTLISARDGGLYVGTDGGLIRLRGEEISAFTVADGLPSNMVTALQESSDGSVWIGTAAGLSRLSNGRITRIIPADKLPHGAITALTEDWSGRLWIGTMRGLASFKNGQLSRHRSVDGFPEAQILALCPSQDGSLWIGTNGAGLQRYRSGKFRVYGAAEGLPSTRVKAVYEDSSGAIWVGTLDRGFGRMRDERIELEADANDAVSSFLQDREGNLWIGTSTGLTRLADGAVVSFAAAEGLADENAKTIHGDRSGTMWVGTKRGLQTLSGSRKITIRDGLSSANVLTALTARDGSLWVGTADAGLNRVEGGRVTSYGVKDGLGSPTILAIYEDRQGGIWVGTVSGLHRLVDGKLTPLALSRPLSGEIVDAIYEDRDGVLWVGTQDGGLNRVANDMVTSFTTRNGLSSDFVLSIHQDSAGTMWIGTVGGGLNRYKNGQFAAITTRQGLYDDSVFAILEDQAGNLWMSCNKGIFRVSLQELNAVADGAIPRVRSVGYGRGDGMKSRECNGGTQPVAWKTPDGKLWFATTKGVAMIDPLELRFSAAALPLLIEGIYADRNKMSPGAKLPPGTRTIEFHYASPTFKTPEKVAFQYKLEGFDKQWTEAGGRRVAYYTNVPPGEYRFQVRAANGDSMWNTPVSTQTLSVQPFFYQTPWFWAGSVLSLIALVWNAHRSRVRLIRASAERFKLLFDRNLAGVYRATIDGRILDCNNACARILGFASRHELTDHRIFDSYVQEGDVKDLLRRLRQHGAVSTFETALRRSDGEAIWVLQNVSLAIGPQGTEILEATLIDITDRKRAEEQIRYQAYHDALTGLPNRTLFKDRLTLALAHAHRHGRQVAVLFLDLDRFKMINDTLGHTVGDHLLQGIAGRLQTCVREDDSVARVGGDEFTLLLMDLRSASDATLVARKILETVARPITVDGHELYVNCSIGISISPADGEDSETLLKNADNALNRAKEAGKNSYQLCTPSMTRLAAERFSLESALRQAIERNEFLLHYQPQFDLRNRRIFGIEALLRWDRPGKGIVRPLEFIAAAEESRLIIPIGEWVLNAASRQAKAWENEKNPLRMAVNVSAAQFQQRHLVRTIREAVEHWAIEPSRLEVEITESTAMQNPDLTAATLQELKNLGISIVIDDFGIGHSSLNYLKRFPIDGIKIDKTFVDDMTRDESGAAIVAAVIAMARALNLRVIAEGVETEEQLTFLESHGCFEFQGYLGSRPLPPEGVTELLRATPSAHPQPALRHVPAVATGRLTEH